MNITDRIWLKNTARDRNDICSNFQPMHTAAFGNCIWMSAHLKHLGLWVCNYMYLSYGVEVVKVYSVPERKKNKEMSSGAPTARLEKGNTRQQRNVSSGPCNTSSIIYTRPLDIYVIALLPENQSSSCDQSHIYTWIQGLGPCPQQPKDALPQPAGWCDPLDLQIRNMRKQNRHLFIEHNWHQNSIYQNHRVVKQPLHRSLRSKSARWGFMSPGICTGSLAIYFCSNKVSFMHFSK